MNAGLILPTDNPSIELRQLQVSDADQVFEAIESNRLSGNQHLVATGVDGWFQTASKVEDAIRRSHNDKWQMIGIFQVQDDTFIGSIDLGSREFGPEIGYWLDERYTGFGYATIATRALSEFALQKYGHVVARTADNNTPSQKVLLKAGFNKIDHIESKVLFEKK